MNKILFLKNLRDFRKSWAQGLALIIIVALGVSNYIALIGAFRDLGTSYAHTYDQLDFADVTFDLSSAPQSVLTDIADLDSVAAVSGRLVVNSGFELADGEQIRSRLIGMPTEDQPHVNKLHIADGRYFEPGDEASAIVEANFAGIYDVNPGDSVTPIIEGQSVKLNVVGVGTSPDYLVVSPGAQDFFPSARTFAVIFMPLSELQSLTQSADTINQVAVLFTPSADPETAVNDIEAILTPLGLEETTLQKDNPSNAALQADLDGYREIADLMPTLILIVAAISVYVMLGRMVRAQQPQIGLMKALGYTRRDILLHYLSFALFIGLTGMILGVLIGIPMSQGITTEYAKELGIPLVETRFYPDLILQSLVLTLILSTLAGLGPARASAKLEPAEAMRLDPSVALVNGRISIIERLIRLPLSLRLPLRNVLRMRRRSLTTGLGVIFTFMLILMVTGMYESMNRYLQRNFVDIEQWDMTAVFGSPQTQATLDEIRSWDGVKDAEPNIQIPATVKSGSQEESILLVAFSPEQHLHQLQLPGGTTVSDALAEGHIVLTEGLADQLDLKIGDTISLDTSFGQKDLTISSLTDELVSSTAYVSLDEILSLSPLPGTFFNGLYLTVNPDSAKTIKDQLYHLPNAASVQLKTDIRQDLEDILGLFYILMGVMLVFVLIMAFALLFNAMTVNVLERERELATMRSIGTGRMTIARQITLESVVLWLLALIPGLILGTLVAAEMGKAISAELFTMKITIAPANYILTSLGILLTMIVAALPAVRRVNRLNLAEATKVLT
ncbi:MAG: FtsX-like permease family protein [Candidatus Promineifilaceae bacterium]